MNKYKYYLFDLDGTISESALGIRESLENAIKSMGKPLPNLDDYTLYIGPPLLDTFRNICRFNEEESARGVEIYREYYNTKGKLVNKLYDGIDRVLAELKNSGKSIEEVRDFAEERKLNVHHWFFSTDLTSYYRGGRITKTAQVFGTMLNICPLLNMDNNGKLIPRTKYRGKKKVIEEIVNRMVEHADGGLDYSGKCYISESACYDDARAVADLVEARFKKLNGKVEINSIGTVIGSHTGPGTVALFFFGDKRAD